MDNNMDNRQKKLEKKRIIVYWITVLGWIISFRVKSIGLTTVLPMSEVMLVILKMNNVYRSLLVSLMELYFRFLPFMVYLSGKMEMDSISKEIVELKENENKQSIYVDLLEEISVQDKIIDEEKILKVYDIIDRFEMLSRDRQMEVLNYIKGDLNINSDQLCEEIEKLDSNYKDILQTECEDILFPEFDEEENSYTRKKNKL